MTNYKEIT